MASVAEIREKYKIYLAGGGKPEKISKSSDYLPGKELYRLIQFSTIRSDSGEKLKLAEKCALAGIPVGQKRTPLIEKAVIVRESLRMFVEEEHGKVEDLKKTDRRYQDVKGLKMKDADGRLLTVEEKFDALGFPRQPKLSKNVRGDLIKRVEKYLADGGDLYEPKASLPFYDKEYKSYAYGQRKKGVVGELAFQTNMRSIGVDYSEMYFQYRKAEEFAKFADEEGFVDSYRKDVKMDSFVKASAYKLGLPIPVFVGLIGNADLKGCYLDTEYFGYVQAELERYLIEHKNFVGLSKLDKPLYEKLKHIKNVMMTSEFGELSTNDVLCALGFDNVDSDFKKGAEGADLSGILHYLIPIAQKNDGKLSRSNIPERDYRKLVGMIASTGATTKAFFKLYEIDYDGKDEHRMARVWVNGYPYMKEMRAERDKLMAEKGVTFSADCKKEDLFDVLIDASVEAFEKYKSQIFNFETERLEMAKVDAEQKVENETLKAQANNGRGK